MPPVRLTLTPRISPRAFPTTAATKFGKIFKAYAKKKGIQVQEMRFLFDGNRIHTDSTPKMLEMEDGDEVNAVLEQEGGGE